MTVGASVPLLVSVIGPRRLEAALGLEGATRPWIPAPVPGWEVFRGGVLWRASRRGVIDQLMMRLQTFIPLGLTAVTHQWMVPVDSPIHAASAVVVEAVPGPALGAGPPGRSNLVAGPSYPVGLRPYRHGDRKGDIHWPTVSRTAAVMVLDRPAPAVASDSLTILVRSSRDEDSDAVADPGTLEGLLRTGWRVQLHTVEDRPEVGPGARWAPVSGGDEVVVRPARARADRPTGTGDRGGSPDPVDDKGGDCGTDTRATGEARLVVDDEGTRWESPV